MRCKNCKAKFTPEHFNQKYCLEADCVQAWLDSLWKQKKKEMKTDLMTVQDYIKKTQTIFNEFIRNRDRGGQCISCGTRLEGKFDAGHYMNANNHWAVRFDERNVWGQCVHCNQHKHGNKEYYRQSLVSKYSEQWVQKLEQDARETRHFTIEELKEIISEYKKRGK